MTEPAPTRRRLRRLRKWLFGLATVLVALYLLRGPLLSGLLRDRIVAVVAEATELTIEIDSVEGNWITGLSLVGVRVTGLTDADELRAVAVGRVDVTYNLVGLLDDPLHAIDSFTVAGAELRLVIDDEPSDWDNTESILADVIDLPLADLPPGRIDGFVSIRDDDVLIEAAIELDIAGDGIDVRIDDLVLALPWGTIRGDGLRTAIRQSDDTLFTDGALELTGARVHSARLHAVDGRVQLSTSIGVGRGSIDATLWRDSIDARSTNIDLRALPPIVEAIVGGPLPSGTLRQASIVLRRGEPARFTDVTATDLHELGLRLGLGGLHIDTLAVASGTFDGEHLTLRNVRAVRASATLDVASAAFDVMRATETLAWEHLRLDLPDASATVGELLPSDGASQSPALLAGSSLTLTSASLLDHRMDVEFEATTPRSSARGTFAIQVPTNAGDGDTTPLRDALRGVDVTATIDLRDVVEAAPPEWQLPRASGRLRVRATATGPADDARAGALNVALNVTAQNLVVDGRKARALAIDARVTGETLTVERLHAETEFGDVDVAATVDLASRVVLSSTVDARSDDLSLLPAAFPVLPAMAGKIEIHAEAAGTIDEVLAIIDERRADLRATLTDTTHATISVAGESLSLHATPLGRLQAKLSLRGAHLSVSEFVLDGDLAHIEVRGSGTIDGRAIDLPLVTASCTALDEFARWIPALEDIRGAAELAGSLRMDDVRAWHDIDGELAFTASELAVAGHTFTTVTINAIADSGSDSGSGEVRVTRFAAGTPWGTVTGGGALRLDEDRIEATIASADIELARSLLALEGPPIPVRVTQPVAIAWTDNQLDVRGLNAALLGGTVEAEVSLGPRVEMQWKLDGLDLTQLDPDARGSLSASLRVSGPTDAADADLTASIPDFGWGADNGRVEIDVRQDEGGIHFRRFEIDAGPRLQAVATGLAPVRLGSDGFTRIADARASITASASSVNPAAWLTRFAPEGARATSATAEIRAASGDLHAEMTVHDLAWIDVADDAGMVLVGPTTMVLDAGAAGVTAVFDGGGGGDLQLRGQLSSSQGVDWRSPRQLIDDLRDAPIEGSLRLDAPDVRSFGAWVDALHHVQGEAHLTATVAGTLFSPELTGRLEASDITLRAESDLASVDQGRLVAALEGQTIRIEQCSGRLGYAPVAISGTLDIADITDPILDLHVTGENAQIIRSEYLRARTDLDVRITGPISGLLVAGTARITDALYSQPIDLLAQGHISADSGFQLFSLRDAPLSKIRFDLHAIANDSVVVDNNIVRGRVSFDMRLLGTGLIPEPVGRAEFREIRVRLPLTRVLVESGSVVFPAHSPFDPQIRASAFARLKGYDLDIQVRGGVSSLRVLIASSPPLSQDEAMLLLATGASPEDYEENGVGVMALSGAGAILGDATVAWLTGPRRPGEDSVMDRLTLDVGRERSETGFATIEAEVELIPRWYVRVERDRWDHYDAGILWRIRFE